MSKKTGPPLLIDLTEFTLHLDLPGKEADIPPVQHALAQVLSLTDSPGGHGDEKKGQNSPHLPR